MNKTEGIYIQHAENNEWINQLEFYKDELHILKDRLEELTSRNTNHDFLTQVEHFQNQWIIQQNNIDEIAHAVRQNEQLLVAEIKRNPVAVDHRKQTYHEEERKMLTAFEHNFNELRSEFNRFCAKWM